MKMIYDEALINPEIPFNTIIEGLVMPKYLYKYQSFYSKDGKENVYWRDSLRGYFHMSLGCEFEDYNDCRPYMDKKEIIERVEAFLRIGLEEGQMKALLKAMDEEITEEYFDNVMSNFRKQIRIGCFTTSSENLAMWEKYSNHNTGFCLEYETEKHILFQHSTLPVLYSAKPYNSSLSLVNQMILEGTQDDKDNNLEEHIKKYKEIYAKQLKVAYIPIFIKEKVKWEFEDEYRMFLLKNRQTNVGLLKASDFLDSNYNVNLSNAISAIYLGEYFDENDDADFIRKSILELAKELHIKVFQKRNVNNKLINEVIS